MEKEIKKVNEVEVKENANTEVEQKEVKADKTLYLERESFVANNGEQYWSYLLKGKIRQRDVKVDFAPKDKGGYEPLDIVFEISDKAELVMIEETMTDAVTGKRTKYMQYKARTIDENGFIYECGIKPSRDSDKALLQMILNQLGCAK